MSKFLEENSPWCSTAVVAASDSTKDIKAAINDSLCLVVTSVILSITTAAAQAFDIEDNSSVPVEVLKLPASLAVGVYQFKLEKGIKLGAGKKLVYAPAAAGVAGFIIVEGYAELV